MRGLLILVAFVVLGYLGYQRLLVEGRSDGGLDQPAFALDDRLPEVIVTREGAAAFRLLPAGPGEPYLVIRDAIQVTDVDGKADRLLDVLWALRIDSLLPGRPAGQSVGLRLRADDREEAAELVFPTRPSAPLALSYRGQPDYFALAPAPGLTADRLRFDYYRSRLLVDLPDLNRGADSIVLERGDSLRQRLRNRVGAEAVAALANPPAAPYADFFDELQFADRQLGELAIYRGSTARRIGIYRDSLWPQPYVLVSRDFHRRYLGLDSLPTVKLPPAEEE